MKQMYRQSEQFYLQHRARTLFFQWFFKARDRRRLMLVVNERFHRHQRKTLKSLVCSHLKILTFVFN